jgi:hypothetical protein
MSQAVRVDIEITIEENSCLRQQAGFMISSGIVAQFVEVLDDKETLLCCRWHSRGCGLRRLHRGFRDSGSSRSGQVGEYGKDQNWNVEGGRRCIDRRA